MLGSYLEKLLLADFTIDMMKVENKETFYIVVNSEDSESYDFYADNYHEIEEGLRKAILHFEI